MRKLVFLWVLASSALFFMPESGFCQEEKFKVIATEEVKSMVDKGEATKLINPMPKLLFDTAAIPGSINIPIDHLETELVKLKPNKEEQLVFYCLGPK